MIRTVTVALLTLTLAMLVTATAWAAKGDKGDKKPNMDQDSRLNQPAPTFDLPGTDGKNHKLTEFKGKTLVIHWQGNQCPWDRAYQPIINKMVADNPNIVFIGINSNKGESIDDIKAIQTKDNIPYIILKDAGNKVADDYGAQTTPHMYIIDATGKLIYLGGVEKAPSGVNGVGKSSEQYLTANLAALKDGKPLPFTKTVPKGCAIKRE